MDLRSTPVQESYAGVPHSLDSPAVQWRQVHVVLDDLRRLLVGVSQITRHLGTAVDRLGLERKRFRISVAVLNRAFRKVDGVAQ